MPPARRPATPSTPAPSDAARRWRRLVRARLAEMETMATGRGAVGPAFWDGGRARRYKAVVGDTAEGDPLFARLAQAAGPGATMIDVGAGTGRFSLALAPQLAEVVAVDPSPAMLAVLLREARRRGVTNIRCVESYWQDAEPTAPADIVLCSYVLPLIEDAAGFLARMNAACRGRAFVYVNAASADLFADPFWRHFHGRPRRPAPTYLDAVGILRQLGLEPEVEVVEVPTLTRFSSVAAAARSYQETLLLQDTAEVRAELRRLLRWWLVDDGAGALRPPVATMPAAIVSWPGSRSSTN